MSVESYKHPRHVRRILESLAEVLHVLRRFAGLVADDALIGVAGERLFLLGLPDEPATELVGERLGLADRIDHDSQRAIAATKVVGVTVLTSLDGDDLASVGIDDPPGEQVARLARLARDSGLDGIVCSGAEVALARENWPGGFFVVPGVRPAGGELGDQKRVVTPRQALDDGASVLVIGRPITGAADPAQAIRDIVATL